MAITLHSASSILRLEEFLGELEQRKISTYEANQRKILKKSSYLTDYFKESDLRDLESQNKRLILEIFLACMIVWILGDYIGKFDKYFLSIDETFEKAEKGGIIFDNKFVSHIKTSFQAAHDLKVDLMKIWEFIPTLNLQELLEEDLLGTTIQRLLPHNLRKSLAANFTSLISAKFLAALSIQDSIEDISDPFSGSGRLLTAMIEEYANKKSLKLSSITLNELFDVAAYLAALRVIYFCKQLEKTPRITLHLGDAFEKLPPPLLIKKGPKKDLERSQMVLMNPPFTRYLRLSSQYLETLYSVCRKYKKYMAPQMGLHIFALFLADALLMPGGRIAAILPAPTFYSSYSDGLKELLLTHYQIRVIVGASTDKAFSEASDLKEIILIADRRKKNEKPTESILFATLNEELAAHNFRSIASSIWQENSTDSDISFHKVPRTELKKNWNWIRFLEHDEIHSLARVLKKSSKIRTAGSLGLRIVRGFEMYGPDFFFLPNRDWLKTAESKTEIIFTHNDSGQSCVFPRTILEPALRKPSFYTKYISPRINHYVLRIKEGQQGLVPQAYIEERRETWRVAEKRFGSKWISHIDRQLVSKKPFGHLFAVDKFGITTTGTFIHYFDEIATASKNFYLIDYDPRLTKLLAAWMSSTLFILLFLAIRREIGGSFSRLQIIDYQTEAIFLDPRRISKESQKAILSAFDKFKIKRLPILRDQIGWDPRRALDLAILDALQIQMRKSQEFLQELYQAVLKAFNEADSRGRKRRGRQ